MNTFHSFETFRVSDDYVETVPLECIPSFSGHLVRFTWKVSVGASRPTVEAKLIRIPFRVLTVPSEFTHHSPI